MDATVSGFYIWGNHRCILIVRIDEHRVTLSVSFDPNVGPSQGCQSRILHLAIIITEFRIVKEGSRREHAIVYMSLQLVSEINPLKFIVDNFSIIVIVESC